MPKATPSKADTSQTNSLIPGSHLKASLAGRAYFGIERMLEFIGENRDRDGLQETPQRVMKAAQEIYAGYTQDPKEIFKTFDVACDEMVVVKDIEFYSMCEHHMLPFFGKVHIGYLPGKRVLGLSKFARLVDVFARRLQVQERLTKQVADALMKGLRPRGVGVIMEAQHLCMMMRGCAKQNSSATTSSMLGSFRKDQKVRAEFLSMVKS